MITNDGKQNDSSKTQLSLRTVGYGDYQGDDPTILIDSNLSPLGTTWGLRACVFSFAVEIGKKPQRKK